MKPRALILQARGTNRDHDAAEALTLSGADAEVVPLNQLRTRKDRFIEYQLLVLAGGFSYADALGAGKLLAIDLNAYFVDEINAFVSAGKPVIGICNGFQALVKAGILPGNSIDRLTGNGNASRTATLGFNSGGHFECRWVNLQPISQSCVWTNGLEEMIECPVAHGEGNFKMLNPEILNDLISHDQVALTYVNSRGEPARGDYPLNPNGSILDIAGICNREGNVLGLMPHPENHIYAYQHPHRSKRNSERERPAIIYQWCEVCGKTLICKKQESTLK